MALSWINANVQMRRGPGSRPALDHAPAQHGLVSGGEIPRERQQDALLGGDVAAIAVREGGARGDERHRQPRAAALGELDELADEALREPAVAVVLAADERCFPA